MTVPSNDSRLRRIGLALAVLALLVVTYALLRPGVPGAVGRFHLDKILHFLAYFGVVLPVALAAPRLVPLAVGLAVLHGGMMELIQPRVGRGAEWADFFADAAGALCGAWVGGRLRPWLLSRLDRGRPRR